MATLQTTTIPPVPIRTPLTDSKGNLARQWITFFQQSQDAVAAKASGGPAEAALYVIGTLAIESDAAPWLYLLTPASPTQMVAYVKQAPTGADLKFTINANGGGADWATAIIPMGETSVTVDTPGAIYAGVPVILSITAVGTTIPGSDLAIFFYF